MCVRSEPIFTPMKGRVDASHSLSEADDNLTFQSLSPDHQAASLSVHKSVADPDKTLMTQKPGKV